MRSPASPAQTGSGGHGASCDVVPVCLMGLGIGGELDLPAAPGWKGSLTGMRRMITRSAWYPESAARTNRPLTALATRLTLIHEEGRIGRCPRVLMDER